MVKRSLVIALCAYASLSLPAPGQQISVTQRVSPQSIYLGESAELSVQVDGVQDPGDADLSGFSDFTVQLTGKQPHSNQSIQIINGRMTQTSRTGCNLTFLLTPNKGGVLTVPSAAFTIDGNVYRGSPGRLVVKIPQPQDYVVVEVRADPPEVWVEQPFDLALEVYMRRPLVRGAPIDADPIVPGEIPSLKIPWFAELDNCDTGDVNSFARPLLARRAQTGFSINDYVEQSMFSMFDRDKKLVFALPRTQAAREGLDGQQHPYFVYTLTKRFTPKGSGTLVIPGVSFAGTVPTEVSPQMRVSDSQEVRASAPPLTLRVKPIPQNRPDTYTGAVGRISIAVFGNPTNVHVGDPITLTMRISGDARLESIGPPRLAGNDPLQRDFKVPEETDAGIIQGEVKVFTQTIRAKSDEVTEIPPIEMAYFDLATGQFQTVRSKPVPIKVAAADKLTMSSVVDSAGDKTTRLTEVTGGILANYSNPDELLADQAFRFGKAWAIGPVLGPAAFLAVWLVQYQRRRLADNVALVRSRKARRSAERTLRQIGSGDGTGADGVADCLLTYVADRCNLPTGGLTRADAISELRRRDVAPEITAEVDQLLQECELSQFGGIANHTPQLVERASHCLARMEKVRI